MEMVPTGFGVELGELFLPDGAGGVDAGAGLVDDDVGKLGDPGIGRVSGRGRGRSLGAEGRSPLDFRGPLGGWVRAEAGAGDAAPVGFSASAG